MNKTKTNTKSDAAQKDDGWEWVPMGVNWYSCRGCHEQKFAAAYYSPKGTRYCKKCGNERRAKTIKKDYPRRGK